MNVRENCKTTDEKAVHRVVCLLTPELLLVHTLPSRVSTENTRLSWPKQKAMYQDSYSHWSLVLAWPNLE